MDSTVLIHNVPIIICGFNRYKIGNITSIPITYFINKDGDIVTYAQGALDEDNLLKGIDMINKSK